MSDVDRARRVVIPVGTDRSIGGLLALPLRRPVPAVIVIHEAFGLNADIAAKCERLARMGYVALAPDLYTGRGPKPLCVMRVMRDLPNARGRAFEDLHAARAWLCTLPEVNASRLGVIGFCMGGGFALLYAVRAPVDVAAVFYGTVPNASDVLRGACPVVASYGGRDTVFRPHAERLQLALTRLGVEHDIKIYPDTGHSFMSQHRGPLAKFLSFGPMRIGYHPDAAEDAWQRGEAFFAKYLRADRDA